MRRCCALKGAMMRTMRPLLLVLITLSSVLYSAEASRPNIVFILADDLGAHDPHCFGSTYHETPNIDRLASRGVKMTQAYAASPLCSPTRSSILAGIYPARSGITTPSCHEMRVHLTKELGKASPQMRAVNADSVTRLKSDYVTLAETMKGAGYATAHFGKWHLGHNLSPDDHYEPKDQGFDFDFPHTPKAPGPGGGYLAPWKFITDPAITGKAGEHIENHMSEVAAQYIREHSRAQRDSQTKSAQRDGANAPGNDKPFFVNYWCFSVHSPWNARQDYIDYFKPKADPKNPQHNPLYAAMVRSLDDGVGNLLKAIDDAGVADNTIIVFFSDNGGWAYPPKVTDPDGYADEPATSNLPQRSGKASLYEGGTREPCIVVWPGKIKPGTENNALFQSTDFYPTLLAMCGLKPQADVKLDGFDQSGTLQGQPSPRDRVFCHFPHGTPNQAVNIPGMLPGTWVRKGDWKLIRWYADNEDGSDRLDLFDLKSDPGESKNLATSKPELVKELNALIDGFLKDTEAVVPVRNPDYGKLAAAPKGKSKANDDEFPGLQGWKARSCSYAVKDGIVTLTAKTAEPYLGVTAGVSGPMTVKLRMRSGTAGDGKIEWIAPKADMKSAKSVPYKLAAGDWQEITVQVPASGAIGILRIYFPATDKPVEIDRIELKAAGAPKKWDF